MANDPMTVTSSVGFNLAPGLRQVEFLVAGPADFDATNGAAFDLSSYFSSAIYNVSFGACDAKADVLTEARYVNDDMTDLDGGAVYFTWATGNAGVGVATTDTTDLSGYVWKVTATGR